MAMQDTFQKQISRSNTDRARKTNAVDQTVSVVCCTAACIACRAQTGLCKCLCCRCAAFVAVALRLLPVAPFVMRWYCYWLHFVLLDTLQKGALSVLATV